MWTALTVPPSLALCGTSVFITSRMNSTSPGTTLSPGLTNSFQTLPGTIVSIFSAMSFPLNNAQCATDRIQFLAQRLRLVDADGFEAIDVARLRLPQLPERRRRHGVGIDESTHARSVVDKDNGCLAGEVDGAQRIALVDDVRRFGAVLRRLLVGLLSEGPLRSIEPEAGAVTLRRQLPIGRQKALVAGLVDPVVVRSRHHFDSPDLVSREGRPTFRLRLSPSGPVALGDRHDLALLQGAPLHAAKARLVEGRARAQPCWRVDAASDGDIAARAGLGRA